jgi:hypothetical protein
VPSLIYVALTKYSKSWNNRSVSSAPLSSRKEPTMIFAIAAVVIVSLLVGFVWFAVRNARSQSLWESIEDAEESASVQAKVTPPDKPKAKTAHA